MKGSYSDILDAAEQWSREAYQKGLVIGFVLGAIFGAIMIGMVTR